MSAPTKRKPRKPRVSTEIDYEAWHVEFVEALEGAVAHLNVSEPSDDNPALDEVRAVIVGEWGRIARRERKKLAVLDDAVTRALTSAGMRKGER